MVDLLYQVVVITIVFDLHCKTLPKIGLFYLDRNARLLLQYVLYLLFASPALPLTRSSLLQGCGAYEIGLNLMIIFPLDFYQLIDLKCTLIPRVWSLGLLCSCPISDYLSTAHQVGSPRINRHFPIGVFFGTIDNELYLYRLLSETLFMFLVGVALTRRDVYVQMIVDGLLQS
jgi:hypothetical protein